MPIARERIVPPAPRRQWLGLGAAAGALVGVVLPPLSQYCLERMLLSEPHGEPKWMGVLWTASYAGTFLLLLAPLVIVLRVTQRWWTVLGFAAGFMLGVSVAAAVEGAVLRVDGGADWSAWVPDELLLGAAISTPIYIAVAAVLLLAYRFLLIRTTERGPDDCAWCGYSRGSPSITRCPECGRDAATGRFRSHAFVTGVIRLARRGWMVAALVSLALGALTVRPVGTKTLPCLAFYHRFATAQHVVIQPWTVAGSAVDGAGSPGAPCVWMPESPGAQRGVYVMFSPARRGAGAGMNIGVSGRPEDGLPMGFMRISADLDERQTLWVLAHGAPDGLVKALYAKAAEVSWDPKLPPKGEDRIDPSPFFP